MDTYDMPQPSAHAHTSNDVSASRLSRLFFTLGQVAIQHLVCQQQRAAHDTHLNNTRVVLSCTNLPCAILLCIAIAMCLLALQAVMSLPLQLQLNVMLT